MNNKCQDTNTIKQNIDTLKQIQEVAEKTAKELEDDNNNLQGWRGPWTDKVRRIYPCQRASSSRARKDKQQRRKRVKRRETKKRLRVEEMLQTIAPGRGCPVNWRCAELLENLVGERPAGLQLRHGVLPPEGHYVGIVKAFEGEKAKIKFFDYRGGGQFAEAAPGPACHRRAGPPAIAFWEEAAATNRIVEAAKLGMALLIRNLMDATREGDGERVARCLKMTLLFFRAYGHTKYALARTPSAELPLTTEDTLNLQSQSPANVQPLRGPCPVHRCWGPCGHSSRQVEVLPYTILAVHVHGLAPEKFSRRNLHQYSYEVIGGNPPGPAEASPLTKKNGMEHNNIHFSLPSTVADNLFSFRAAAYAEAGYTDEAHLTLNLI
ncbi:hypothetical protein Bbelb_050550 [Branchiostoma belcheri]|nr:hypothetical protein Bbelb_050550 [Branchiostoma belcheri]